MSQDKKITDIKGRSKIISCIACALEKGEVENTGLIAETENFTAEQDYEIPIPGFFILRSKKHIQSIDEFTEQEQSEFIKFLCRLRLCMRKSINIEHIYIIQEEDTNNSHFHVWLFPRYNWMEEKFGKKIESVKPIMEYARENLKTKDNLKVVDTTVQKIKNCF